MDDFTEFNLSVTLTVYKCFCLAVALNLILCFTIPCFCAADALNLRVALTARVLLYYCAHTVLIQDSTQTNPSLQYNVVCFCFSIHLGRDNLFEVVTPTRVFYIQVWTVIKTAENSV